MSINYVPLNVTKNINTGEDAGDLNVNKFVFDLAHPDCLVAGAPARISAIALGDAIQVGTIPAGEILVPHLCLLNLAQIDTGATGNASLGITGTPAAIMAAKSVQAASVTVGSGFAITTGEVGADNADVPVWLTFTAAVATLATTGLLQFTQVTRPWSSMTDGPSTT